MRLSLGFYSSSPECSSTRKILLVAQTPKEVVYSHLANYRKSGLELCYLLAMFYGNIRFPSIKKNDHFTFLAI
eukprot:snap_masked-scaffold_7-processed-gene-8.46-mRNA-1 protein AED:1.00 eAED:1.00 QI:0/-1/0/0/-1/1/1/0/72